MRKLASIQKIRALEPILEADAIEKASVLGWQLIVKKGEFSVGDMVVYCEIDSLMPDRPEFMFLKPRAMRIKTIRLRGQISQGICFPVSVLPNDFEIIENAECTHVLGITKYEPILSSCLNGIAKGKFPSFIPKTEQARVQVLQEFLDNYKGQKCYITEKLDGSSATYFIKDNIFGVCSRNLELINDDENSYWKVAKALDIENKLRLIGKNISVQGELLGPGIQSNKLKLKEQTVRFFDAFDIDKYEYLNFNDCIQLFKNLDLPTVPILSTDYILENDIESIIQMSIIKSTVLKDVWAEGIIIRAYEQNGSRFSANENFKNGRVSFKAINPEFLLKYGE